MELGTLIQMATLGLILIGAAMVLLGSIVNPRQADPMGIFGLPTVCAIACRPIKVRNRTMRSISTTPHNLEQHAA